MSDQPDQTPPSENPSGQSQNDSLLPTGTTPEQAHLSDVQAGSPAGAANEADSTAASDAPTESNAASEAATSEAVPADSTTPESSKPISESGPKSTSNHSKVEGSPRSKAESKAESTRSSNVSHSRHSTSKVTSSHATRTSNTAGTGTSGASAHRKRIKLGELDLSSARIGFLGAGKVAESTINGLIHYGKISPGRIYVAAPSSKGLERFKTLGCHVSKRNYDIFGRYDCDIVFLAFHGYVIKHCYKLGGNRPHPLCTNYIPHQRHPVYILSLVSGVSLGQIKAVLLNPESPSRYVVEIHRIMVNTAVGHGLGLCAIDCEPDSKKLSAPIRQLLSSIAHLEYVPATQMDAACAIGGSGLAFSYYFINALADGAFRMGLSRQQAIRFASKTAQCAAQTMLESGKHPAELRDNVSAPSGAAIYGIHVLEKNDVASGVTAAVEAAHKRAHDLATQDVTQ